MKSKNIKSIRLVFLFLTLVSIATITEFSWNNSKGSTSTIYGDGLGYYQYLPSYFIYNNLNNLDSNISCNVSISGKVLNKFYVGTSLLMSPFFGLAILHTNFTTKCVEPYTPLFHKWISVAGLFYLLWGLVFTFRCLRYFQFPVTISLITICLLLFGTNLFFYGLLNPSMSHIYSFFTIAAYCYFLKKYFLYNTNFNLYFSAFFFALTVLIRPINGLIILLIPLFLSKGQTIFGTVKKLSKLNFIIIFSIVGLLLFIQAYAWHLQIGEWVVWNYKDEGFYFSSPKITEVLFSFRKGWFIYTPLAFVSLFGFFKLYKKNKSQFFILIYFFIVLVYIISSWWNWYYGPSFGQRPFIDFYFLIAFLLANLLLSINSTVKVVLITQVSTFCVILNLVQTYQYNENILSTWDMSFEKYKATFFVMESNKEIIGGHDDISPYKANPTLVVSHQQSDSITNCVNNLYNLTTKTILDSSFQTNRGLILKGSYSRLEPQLHSSENAKIIVDIKDKNGERYIYTGFLINETPAELANEWVNTTFSANLPKPKSNGDLITIYLLNPDEKEFLIKGYNWKIFKY